MYTSQLQNVLDAAKRDAIGAGDFADRGQPVGMQRGVHQGA